MCKGAVRSGFTLLELLTVLAISSLLMGIAIPKTTQFYQRSIAQNQITQLRQILNYTRNQAITYHTPTTLCPLTIEQKCGNNWNDELTVFQDRNSNSILEDGENILFILPKNENSNGHRTYNNSRINFNEKGFAGFDAGSLSYCHTGQQTYGVCFTISRIGRVRTGLDANNDGLPETPNGRNIPCS